MLPRCDWAAGFFGFWSLALAPVGVIADCLCAWGLGRLVMQEGSCSECLFVFRNPAVFLLTGGCYEVVGGIFVLVGGDFLRNFSLGGTSFGMGGGAVSQTMKSP